MKRLVLRVLMVVAILVGWYAAADAAGTVVHKNTLVYGNVFKYTMTMTADASAATVPSTATLENIDGFVFLVVTDPGSTAPTTLYDIVLNDSGGVDIMGGELANRSATATEQAVPLIDSAYGARFVAGPLTMVLSNNAVNSAIVVMDIYYYRPSR